MEKNEFQELLKKGLAYLGISVNEKSSEQFWEYMCFLIEENQRYNLTAIEDPEEIVIKHFLDSLTVLKEKRFKPGERVVDIGTGAGFPGLVLKINQPEIEMFLVDSLSKRIGFLNRLITRLQLKGVQTIHVRVEDLGRDYHYRQSFDWVLSRAVAPINILSEYTLPLAKIGGMVVFYKGPDYVKELEEGGKAIQLLGGTVQEIQKIKLPELMAERYLLFVKKIEETPVKYPRKAGIPKKRPL